MKIREQGRDIVTSPGTTPIPPKTPLNLSLQRARRQNDPFSQHRIPTQRSPAALPRHHTINPTTPPRLPKQVVPNSIPLPHSTSRLRPINLTPPRPHPHPIAKNVPTRGRPSPVPDSKRWAPNSPNHLRHRQHYARVPYNPDSSSTKSTSPREETWLFSRGGIPARRTRGCFVSRASVSCCTAWGFSRESVL